MLSGCQVVAGLGKSWQQPGLFGDQQLLQFSEALRNKATQCETQLLMLAMLEIDKTTCWAVGQHVKKQDRLQQDGDDLGPGQH